MCTSKVKTPQINGKAVLQPAGNRLHSPPSLKKKPLPPIIHVPSSKPSMVPNELSPPISPKLIKPTAFRVKRSNYPNGLNSSIDKPVTSRSNPIKATTLVGKQTKKPSYETLVDLSTLIVHAPGAIAAARREQFSLLQAQRKMKIAHYGRTSARLQEMGASWDDDSANSNDVQEEKKCSFITANSGTYILLISNI